MTPGPSRPPTPRPGCGFSYGLWQTHQRIPTIDTALVVIPMWLWFSFLVLLVVVVLVNR